MIHLRGTAGLQVQFVLFTEHCGCTLYILMSMLLYNEFHRKTGSAKMAFLWSLSRDQRVMHLIRARWLSWERQTHPHSYAEVKNHISLWTFLDGVENNRTPDQGMTAVFMTVHIVHTNVCWGGRACSVWLIASAVMWVLYLFNAPSVR